MDLKCTKCHIVVRATDYFCFNCGNNLKPTPPSIKFIDQLVLYIKSILLPPFGIFFAIVYLKQNDSKSKIIGTIAILLTLISLVVSIILFADFMKTLNEQLNNQINLFSF